MIIYQGSGPGASTQALHRLTAGGAVALEIEGLETPGFPSIDRTGKFFAVVARTGQSARLHTALLTEPVIIGRKALRLEPPLLESRALYHPRLSPGGKRLAVIETPDAGYPAKRGAIGRLALFRRAGLGWLREPIDQPMAVEAFDFGSDDDTLIAVAPSGDLALMRLDRPDRAVSLSPGGRQPAVSPDGQAIAYLDAGKLWLIDDAGQRPLDLPGTPSAACFTPDGTALLVATTTGFWQATLWRLPLAGGAAEALHQTAAIGWVGVAAG